jgi:hypothetical protein
MPVARQPDEPDKKPPSTESNDREKYGDWYPQYSLLTMTLQLAVPLWIERLRGASWDYISERAKVCAQVVAEKGDIILFRSKTKGETANAFNRLAEGIACLSFVPGGVTVFGQHWEATMDDDVPARSKVVLSSLLESLLKGLKGTEPCQ